MEVREIIEMLSDIIVELDARDSTNNCVIPDFQDVPWVYLCDRGIELFEDLKGSKSLSTLEFRNELVNRLNNNASRYVGGSCNGRFYPDVELFDVDEVYEIIDRVYDGIPEDTGE